MGDPSRPADQSLPAQPQDPRVDAALHDYLERVDRGETIDPERFVAGHPEIAGELRSLIEAEGQLRKFAGARAAGADSNPDTSTRSFALHGQETIAPQANAPGGTDKGSRLKEVFGRYRIVRVLGQGAMGTVYLAEDTQLKRQVALKTPHFEKDPTGELLERLYREARAAANLRHPNICPVYDVGEIEGTHYISMAYIEGHPLSDFVRSHKQQPERQILIVVRKLAQGLQEAHEQKIVHRDLKPANIMVDKRGEPLIMDFGLARYTRPDEDVRLTHSGTLVGTPAYMSPEQVDGNSANIGAATDQYSLGVILYELLTGQLPFRGSMMAVLGQIVTKEAPAPGQSRAGLDPRIDALCQKMMAKNPADRFASLAAVADEMATILRNPAPQSAATGKSTAGLTPPAPGQSPSPTASRASASQVLKSQQILKSQKQKALTASDLASLEELARKCWTRYDYEQIIQIAQRIPEEKRSDSLQALLDKALAKNDEISFLLVEIEEAVRLDDGRTVLKKAEDLLKIKPGHHRALEVQEQFTGTGSGVVRFGARAVAQAWGEGGWVPWSVLAFGLAVLGVMSGVIIWWTGRTLIEIETDDPNIKVEFKDQKAFLTVPGTQRVVVTPGDGEFTLSYGDLETVTKKFSIKPGTKKHVTVAIRDKQLVALFEGESAPALVESEKAKNGGAAPGESRGPPSGGTAAGTSEDSAGEFVSLFNGKDLTGWKTHPKQPGNWRVENGILIGSGPPERSHLYTERDDFKNFHLRVEARINQGGNSGLYFRSTFGPERPADNPRFPFGYEAQIDSSVDPARTGSLFVAGKPMVEVSDTLVPPGQWFTEEVIAQGNQITVKVNGQTTAVYRDEKELSASGHIALQQNNAKTIAEFRKIEIKELTPDAAPASSEGYVPLFNGRDLAGWTTDPHQKGDWHVQNGVLTAGGPSVPSTLYSERADYRDFHLRAEARLAGDASSGLCFRTEIPPLESPTRKPTTGYEIELTEPEDRNAPRTGSVYGLGSGGPDGQTRTGFKFSKPIVEDGKWFTIDVFAEGLHTVVMINGQTTLDNHWIKKDFRVGRIALSQHMGKPSVEFRKIEIKELTAGALAEAPVRTSGSYVPLFNGQTLNGWTPDPKHPGGWHVENGILSGGPAGEGSVLYSDRDDYKNFRLRVEARINDKGASDLWVRTQIPPADATNRKPPFGFEVDLREPADRSRPRTGSIWAVRPKPDGGRSTSGFSRTEPMVQPGRWFTLEIVAEGTRVYVLVNGELSNNTNWFKRDQTNTPGRIAIEQHVGEPSVEYRKIEIKELPDPSVAGGRKSTRPFDKDALVAPFDESQAKAAQQTWADRLKAPVDTTNTVGLQMRLIPPGEYRMGADDGAEFQKPEHTVRITHAFYLGTYEVTRGQFARFVAGNHQFKTRAERSKGGGWRLDNNSDKRAIWDGKHPFTWRAPGFPQDDSHPVVNVSWDDAEEFCAWLSKVEGKTYRLPTEAEWEYACRAGTTTGRYNGRGAVTEIANFADASTKEKFRAWGGGDSSDGYLYTSPVGQFRPNSFGLYDMLGNALEWCHDWYDDNYYKTSPEEDPPGPQGNKSHSVRGGAFTGNGAAGGRWHWSTDHHAPDCGFRVVCEIPTVPAAAGVPKPAEVTAAAPAAGVYRCWQGGKHIFERIAPGQWRESDALKASTDHRFDEVSATGEYVELVAARPTGEIRLRLFNDRILMHSAEKKNKKWRRLYFGKWVPKPAEMTSPSPDSSPDDAFFNGNNLDGWRGLPGYWHVKDGAIIGSVPAGRTKVHTFLCSNREYKDFELKFRARLLGGVGNSGMQFRSKFRDPKTFWLVGPQCEICAQDRNRKYPTGSLVTEPTGEPSVKPPAADVDRVFKLADFNDFEIRCVGQHVRIKLNGQITVDADFPSMPAEGMIGWQLHGKDAPREVTFKDIEFTDLSAAPADGP